VIARSSTKHPNSETVWDRCYDFRNIYAEKMENILGVLTQIAAVYLPMSKKIIAAFVFEKIANFMSVNCSKSTKIMTTTLTPGRTDPWSRVNGKKGSALFCRSQKCRTTKCRNSNCSLQNVDITTFPTLS
jgi:hypothetical protein